MKAKSGLMDVAIQEALNGATHYLNAHDLEADTITLDACLISWIKIKLPEALDDVREALDAGMGEMAGAAFLAAMIQAGIEAAKECGFPKSQQEE